MTLDDIMEQYRDSPEARDIGFIFAWQLARVLAHGHARGHEAELMSDKLCISMIGHLDGGQYSSKKGALAPWLTYVSYQAGVKASYDTAMHNPTGECITIDDELEQDFMTYLPNSPEMDSLRKAVAHLPNENWTRTMMMKYDDHMSNRDIAIKLGVAEGTVNQYHHRALEFLRKVMKGGEM